MERYTVREIRAKDLKLGFLDALKNLSEVGELSQSQLTRILVRVKKNPFHKIFVAVAEDGTVLGTSTLLIEPKFSHSGGLAGHIEDVSVRANMTGKGVGRALVEATVAYARRKGCYKCILSCKEDNVKFYERFGFRVHEREMRLDLLESEFKPDYIRRVARIQKEPVVRVGSSEDLKKKYGLK